FALVGASATSPQLAKVVWDSLTLVVEPAGARVPLVAVVMAAAWLLGGLLLLGERARMGVTPLLRHGRVMFAAAFILLCASFLVFAVIRTELAVPLTRAEDLVPGRLELCHHGWQAFLTASALILAVLAITRVPIVRSVRTPTWPRTL